MEPVLISFIIVNFRTPDLVLQCVRSILEHTGSHPYEIIVVDNASGDDSLERLGRVPQISLIANARNLGFGAANNRGARVAKGKYLFFLNSDTYLLNNAATIFYDFMEDGQHRDVGCCGGNLLDQSMQKQVSFGNFPSLAEACSQLGFYRLYRAYYAERLAIGVTCQGVEPRSVDYISGADMFFRSEVFHMLGGFDEDFFLYFEEAELSYRMQRRGFRSVVLPSVPIVHLERGSQQGTGHPSETKTVHFERSRQLYFKKTQGRAAALTVKLLLCAQAIGRWFYHRDRHYLKVFRIIAQA